MTSTAATLRTFFPPKNPLIDERAEVISRVLLDLMNHLARAMQEEQHERHAIGRVEQWPYCHEHRCHETRCRHPMGFEPCFQIPHHIFSYRLTF